MNRPVSLSLIALAALVACNGVLGLETRPARDGVGGGAGQVDPTAGGVPTCDGPCSSAIPAGWSGPTAMVRGPNAVCDGALSNEELVLGLDPQAAPTECACACDDAAGVNCDASPIQVTTYDDNNCTSFEESGAGVLGECIRVVGANDSAHFTKAVADVSAASCAPITLASTMPREAFAEELLGCGPVAERQCGAETCFTVPANAPLCIYRSGEHSCPAEVFSERMIAFSDIADNRECSPCACGAVDASDCGETVIAYNSSVCSAGSVPMSSTPSCTLTRLDSARINAVNPTGSCTPGGGEAIGGLAGDKPTTLCCTR